MTDPIRKSLVEFTTYAYQAGKIKSSDHEDLLRFYMDKENVGRIGDKHEVQEWFYDNDALYGDIVDEIFDEAINNEEPEPITKKRKNPDLLTNDTSSEFFAQVPGSLARDTRVSAMAFRIYVCLMLRAGSKGVCWPSQELLAREVGLQVRQLREHLKDLEDSRWITVQRRRNKPSIYQLNHTVKNRRP